MSRHKKHPFVLLGGLILLSLWLLAPAQAWATTAADVLVGMNSLFVLVPKYKEPVRIGIVYDPDRAESLRDAKGILAAFDNRFAEASFPAPQMDFAAELVSVANVEKLKTKDVAFLARGLSFSTFETIAALTEDHRLLTMSVDLECVKANTCILGIVSRPQVDIYLSEVAASRAKIKFFDIFTLLTLKIPQDPHFVPTM